MKARVTIADVGLAHLARRLVAVSIVDQTGETFRSKRAVSKTETITDARKGIWAQRVQARSSSLVVSQQTEPQSLIPKKNPDNANHTEGEEKPQRDGTQMKNQKECAKPRRAYLPL
jgi:hypothetical protein